MLTTLLEAAVRDTALVAAVWALLKVFRLRDLTTEKNVWTFVATASLVMPLLAWLASVLTPPLSVLPIAAITFWPAAASESLMGPAAPMTGSSPVLFAASLYVVGALVLLARLVTGLWIGARLRLDAVKISTLHGISADVRVSAAIRSPASFASTILLPPAYRSWDQPTLAAVLAHEQAHVRNHDGYRLWLVALYRALFWFNPVVYWLHWRLRVLAELTSDEAAAKAVGDPAAYAATLARLASASPYLAATLAMAEVSSLSRRLRRLSTDPPAGIAPSRFGRSFLVTALVSLVGLSLAPWSGAMVPAAQGRAGLEFHLVDELHDAQQAQRSGQVPSGDQLYPKRDGSLVLLRRSVVADGSEVSSASAATTTAGPTVMIQMNRRGAAAMLRATRENLGHRLAVVYNGQVISDAVIRGEFGEQFEVTGLTAGQAQSLAMQLSEAMRRPQAPAVAGLLPGIPAPKLPSMRAYPKARCIYTTKAVLDCVPPADPSLCLVSTSCWALEKPRPRLCSAGDRSCKVDGRVVPLTAYSQSSG